jgi:hypothetical protein
MGIHPRDVIGPVPNRLSYARGRPCANNHRDWLIGLVIIAMVSGLRGLRSAGMTSTAEAHHYRAQAQGSTDSVHYLERDEGAVSSCCNGNNRLTGQGGLRLHQ